MTTMITDIDGLAERIGRGLGVGLRVAVMCEVLLQRSHRCPDDAAPARWASQSRLGRAALRQLFTELDLPRPVQALRFPHRRISLTHSGGWALALGCTEALEKPAGIGVDLEWDRQVPPAAVRLFATPLERRWLGSDAERPCESILRLWTIKEAVFKANLGNRGTRLHHYEIATPRERRGFARGPQGTRFCWTSTRISGGVVSAARALPTLPLATGDRDAR